jgi:hypothetical protein
MKWLKNPLSLKKKQSPHTQLTYPVVRPYSAPLTGRRKRIPSSPIQSYFIPLSLMEGTDKIFRKWASRTAEGYAWWTGHLNSKAEAQICSVLYPEVKTYYGRIHLDRRMMSAMHRKLIELDQILLAELHTHPPGAGGQNEVDADNAAIFYPGFITIVVPNFAKPRFYDLRNSFIYEYQHSGLWRKLEKSEISKRFVIEESLVEVKTR